MSAHAASNQRYTPGLGEHGNNAMDVDSQPDAEMPYHGGAGTSAMPHIARDALGISQVESSQGSNARHPPPQYTLHFNVSDTETQFAESQPDEAHDGSGSQKENTPLHHNSELTAAVAATSQVHNVPSPSPLRGAYKGVSDGSMPPPPSRPPFAPSTPPLKNKPARGVSFTSPYSSSPSRQVARSKTFPTHLTPGRPDRSPSPPSHDSFGGPVPIDNPAREYERNASPFHKTSSQLLAASPPSPDSTFSSHWTSLYGPRSSTKTTEPTSIGTSAISDQKGLAATDRMFGSNKPLYARRSATSSPEPDATQSSLSSLPTRSQMERSYKLVTTGHQMDTGLKPSTRAAVFDQSQELNPFAASQVSNASSIPGLNTGYCVAEELVPTQPATQVSTQPATQLEPTQLEPTQLEPTQLDKPVQLPIQISPPELKRPRRLTRPVKRMIKLQEDESDAAHVETSMRHNGSLPPMMQASDYMRGSDELVTTQDNDAIQLEYQAPAFVPAVPARLLGRSPPTHQIRNGAPAAISAYDDEPSAEPIQKRKRVAAAPMYMEELQSPSLSRHSPPKKKARNYENVSDIVPPSDLGEDGHNVSTQAESSWQANRAKPPPAQVSRPPPSADHVSATEDELEDALEEGTDAATDDDDVPLVRQVERRRAPAAPQTKVDCLKRQHEETPSSSPEVPLALAFATRGRLGSKENTDQSDGESFSKVPSRDKMRKYVTETEEAGGGRPAKSVAGRKHASSKTPTTLREKGKGKVKDLLRKGLTESPMITPGSGKSRKNSKPEGKCKEVVKRAMSHPSRRRRRNKSKSTSGSATPNFLDDGDAEGTEPATTEVADDYMSMPVDTDDEFAYVAGMLPVPVAGPSRMRSRRGTKSTMLTISTSTIGGRAGPRLPTRTSNSRLPKTAPAITPSRLRVQDDMPKPRVLALWNTSYYPGSVLYREGTKYRIAYDDNTEATVKLTDLRRLEVRRGDEVRWGAGRNDHGTVQEYLDKPPQDQVRQYVLKVRGPKSDEIFEPPGPSFWISKAAIKVWDDRKFDIADLESVPIPSIVSESPVTRLGSRRMTDPTISTDGYWRKTGFVVTGFSSNAERQRIAALVETEGGRIVEEWTDVFSKMGNSHDPTLWVATQDDLVYDPSAGLERIYLLSDMPCRKPKYLVALALGIPCISFRWIFESSESEKAMNFAPFLLPAGTSKHPDRDESRLAGLSWGQLADLSWGNTIEDLLSIKEARCAYRLFENKACLVVGEHYVPAANAENDTSVACVPRIILAMGARIVVAVKPGSARKAGEVLDPNADPDSDFGRNICYDYVVYERPEDLIKIPQSVQRAKGVRCVDWNWVTDCLIARKLFEQPEED